MSLMRPRPLSEVREQMDRLFHEIEDLEWPAIRFRPSARNGEQGWCPSIDLVEGDKQYKLMVEVPGIRPEDINVEVDETTVVISGSCQEAHKEETETMYRCELHHGKFYRRVPLPGKIKADAAQAEFKHGLLCLTLPKSTEEKRKRIKVNVR